MGIEDNPPVHATTANHAQLSLCHPPSDYAGQPVAAVVPLPDQAVDGYRSSPWKSTMPATWLSPLWSADEERQVHRHV